MGNVIEARRRILLNTPHIETTSGGVANFKTDMIAPLKGCKINFLPKQSGSGDPSPTNIRPISGWDGVSVTRCGKNLFSGTEKGVLYPLHLKVGTVITVSVTGTGSGVRYYDKDQVQIDYWTLTTIPGLAENKRGKTFTIINRDCEYVEIYGGYPTEMQIELGSTPTTYEPYAASTFPISWTQQGTVYGGYVDLVSGELVAEWERQFVDKNSQIGIFPWGGIMTDSVSGQEYASVLFRRGSLGRPINNAWQYCYCDKLPLASGRVINTAYMYDGDTYGACISLPTSLIGTTIEEVEAYMENNTFDFVYKLRSPIRYQLTPQQIKTLKGINNVYSDADSAEVKFWTH